MAFMNIKSAVIYTMYPHSPLQYIQLRFIDMHFTQYSPFNFLALYDLTTKVLEGNAEVGKGTLNLPLLYRCNFRDEGEEFFPPTCQLHNNLY